MIPPRSIVIWILAMFGLVVLILMFLPVIPV